MAFSNERFSVVYRIAGDESQAAARAEDIALEDTVELPADLIGPGSIREHVIGRVESVTPLDTGACEARVSFAVETAGTELTQFLNVVFGNISIKPGIRLQRFELPDAWARHFGGPRFGIEGLRARLRVPDRPLLCSAIKPMGMSPAECAELAGRLAAAGVDIVKDDHGLADQPFARFEDRARACADAVQEANRRVGTNAIYMPNVTGAPGVAHERSLVAASNGAGGLLVSPGLTGYEVVRALSRDDAVDLPIMVHPSFQGSFTAHPDSGLSHGALYGQLARLAGADATIFPNHGGRFSFTREECARIAEFSRRPMNHLRPIFPTPGGGMSLDRVGDMHRLYGLDVIYLIGAGLFRHATDLGESVRAFHARLAEAERSES